MTREEAIKELEEDKALYMPEEWIESLDRDTPDGRLITAIDMAIEALKQTRWIPVSERLPETNNEVLVTYIVNGNHKRRYVETANYYNYGKEGGWSSVNDEYRIPGTKVEVIAWMELPEPYKAESEGV